MKLSNRGQSLIEALFVVVFTTIIMFAFLQLCIIVVDDMSANEAAFSAMRSAAVTEGSIFSKENKKLIEAGERVKSYMLYHYPLAYAGSGTANPSKFGFSDKNAVSPYFVNTSEKEEEIENGSITIWADSKNTLKDYSGESISAHTLKIYYFTRVMFGGLTARDNSVKDAFYSGSRRYQSARSRMVPSPDGKYYYKAFPGAKKFEE